MAESMLKSNQERRRYFRVTDLVGLRYQFLSQDEQDLAIQAKPSSLKDLLKQIDNEVLANLAVIQSSQPEVTRILRSHLPLKKITTERFELPTF